MVEPQVEAGTPAGPLEAPPLVALSAAEQQLAAALLVVVAVVELVAAG